MCLFKLLVEQGEFIANQIAKEITEDEVIDGEIEQMMLEEDNNSKDVGPVADR